ncbi:hypothetical protein ACQP1W_00610 [Spirillospora sp. CA-255316]
MTRLARRLGRHLLTIAAALAEQTAAYAALDDMRTVADLLRVADSWN